MVVSIMNTGITTVFAITGVIVAILLFAAGPIVAANQARAWGGYYDGCGYGRGGYTYGCNGFYTG
jgi:hypothetical protein